MGEVALLARVDNFLMGLWLVHSVRLIAIFVALPVLAVFVLLVTSLIIVAVRSAFLISILQVRCPVLNVLKTVPTAILRQLAAFVQLATA